MGKRKRWQVKALDAEGNPVLMRANRGGTERHEGEDHSHRAGLRRMLAREDQREQDREVRLTFGLAVR